MADIHSAPTPGHAVEHRVNLPNPDEQMVRSRLLLSYPDGKFNVKRVRENVFAIGMKDTWWFEDKAGKILVNPVLLRGDDEKALKRDWKEAFRQVTYQAWYQEENDPKTDSYVLYGIKGKERRIIPKDTQEYFEAWREIDFFFERLRTVLYAEWAPKSDEHRVNGVKRLESAAERGYVRIHDLIILSAPKLGYLKYEDFNKLIPLARKSLLAQIWDPKWERTLDPVTKKVPYSVTREELDQYKSLGLVDAGLYAQAIKKLSDVEWAKQQKAQTTQQILEWTKGIVGKIKP
jgi:hypothetical protein